MDRSQKRSRSLKIHDQNDLEAAPEKGRPLEPMLTKKTDLKESIRCLNEELEK